MRKISKNIIVMTIIMLIILIGGKTVNAEDVTNGIVKMSLSSNSRLTAGQNITVNVNMLNVPSEGIGSIKGILNFDSNVIEYVSSSQQGDWQSTPYTKSNSMLGIERNNLTKTTGTIATITFKVKETISVDSTRISYALKDLGDGAKLDSNDNEITILEPSITIYANKDATENSSQGTVKPNTSQNEQKENNAKNNKNTKTNNISTSKTMSKKLPKAGDGATITIISIGAIVLIIAIIGVIKYVKQKDIK